MTTRRSPRFKASPPPEDQKPFVPWHLLIQNRAQVDALERLLKEHHGPIPVKIHIGNRIRRMDGGLADTEEVRLEVARWFGIQPDRPNSDTSSFQESKNPSTNSDTFSDDEGVPW